MKIIISNISKSSIDVVICQVSAYLKKVSGYYVKLEGEAFNSSEKQIKGCFFRIPTLPKGNAEVSLRFVKMIEILLNENGEVAERPKALPC